MTIKELLEEKSLIVNSFFLSVINKLNLDLKEFLFLLYFVNDNEKLFDVKKISDIVKISESDVLSSFNSLIKKKIIVVESKKNNNGKISEYIKLDYFYNEIENNIKNDKIDEKNDNIYSVFEREFARPISSIEYEIIKAWLDSGFSEELIKEAIKEATMNNVSNLRYIDKILFEWSKAGIKTSQDVEKNRKKRNDTRDKQDENIDMDIIDYNWFDDDDE